MKESFFKTPWTSIQIKDQITNPNIIVGDYSYYSGYYSGHSFDDCARYLSSHRKNADQLIIGSFCSIGDGAIFMMSGNQGHRHDWASTYPFYYQDFEGARDTFVRAGDTVIGNDVWIGSNAIIMPGVKIGDGAVIATASLVSKDVPPYTIFGGNPGKEIKKRFTEKEINMLLELQWWHWDIEKIKANMNLMCSTKIRELYMKNK